MNKNYILKKKPENFLLNTDLKDEKVIQLKNDIFLMIKKLVN